jgi:hypothetical protein
LLDPLGIQTQSVYVGTLPVLQLEEFDQADPVEPVHVSVQAGELSIVSVNAWLAGEPIPLLALNAMGYVPDSLAVGVPARVPVDAVKVTPAGRDPDSARTAVGTPVAATVNESALPMEKMTAEDEVMAGAWSTTRLKD